MIGNLRATPKGKSIKATKRVKASCVANTSNVEDKEKTTMEEKRPNTRVDGASIGRK